MEFGDKFFVMSIKYEIYAAIIYFSNGQIRNKVADYSPMLSFFVMVITMKQMSAISTIKW